MSGHLPLSPATYIALKAGREIIRLSYRLGFRGSAAAGLRNDIATETGLSALLTDRRVESVHEDQSH